jgi:hypothetical protein
MNEQPKGQPKEFAIAAILTREKAAGSVLPVAPTTTIQAGDKLTLKTYLFVNGDAMVNNYVGAALATGTITYYFEDLDSGGTPVKKVGVTPFDALIKSDVEIALGIKPGPPSNAKVIPGELEKLGLSPDGDWFLSGETSDITTGTTAGVDLLVPPPQKAGSWRVLTAVWGGQVFGKPSQVAAHADELLIQVTT